MKIKYEIIIYWSNEDNCFIAEAPNLRDANQMQKLMLKHYKM